MRFLISFVSRLFDYFPKFSSFVKKGENEKKNSKKEKKLQMSVESTIDDKGDFTLYTSGYPYDTTRAEIEELFQKYGKIQAVMMQLKNGAFNGVAFIKFFTRDQAERAIDGENCNVFRGKVLKVRIVNQKARLQKFQIAYIEAHRDTLPKERQHEPRDRNYREIPPQYSRRDPYAPRFDDGGRFDDVRYGDVRYDDDRRSHFRDMHDSAIPGYADSRRPIQDDIPPMRYADAKRSMYDDRDDLMQNYADARRLGYSDQRNDDRMQGRPVPTRYDDYQAPAAKYADQRDFRAPGYPDSYQDDQRRNPYDYPYEKRYDINPHFR